MKAQSRYEKQGIGRPDASLLLRRSVLSGPASGWLLKIGRSASVLTLMKKPSQRDHSSETTRRSGRDCRKQEKKDGGWSFSLTSDKLFALGSTEQARRVAYRTATGELRFLPL
jgi:hypothetical protein